MLCLRMPWRYQGGEGAGMFFRDLGVPAKFAALSAS
jgi:hypothetical protein